MTVGDIRRAQKNTINHERAGNTAKVGSRSRRVSTIPYSTNGASNTNSAPMTRPDSHGAIQFDAEPCAPPLKPFVAPPLKERNTSTAFDPFVNDNTDLKERNSSAAFDPFANDNTDIKERNSSAAFDPFANDNNTDDNDDFSSSLVMQMAQADNSVIMSYNKTTGNKYNEVLSGTIWNTTKIKVFQVLVSDFSQAERFQRLQCTLYHCV
jgi:hypothetical protein